MAETLFMETCFEIPPCIFSWKSSDYTLLHVMPNLHYTASAPDDALRTRLLLEIVFCRLNFPDCNIKARCDCFPAVLRREQCEKQLKVFLHVFIFFILDDLPSNGNEQLRASTYKLLFLWPMFLFYHCSNHQKNIETSMSWVVHIN